MGKRKSNLMDPYIFVLIIIFLALIFTAAIVKYMVYNHRTREPDMEKIKDELISKVIPEIPEFKK